MYTIVDVIKHHENWAKSCNLKFNKSKIAEFVFPARKNLSKPSQHHEIERTSSLKMLGITFDSRLNFAENENITITACNRSFYALRAQRQHGLADEALHTVFKATTLSKLLYACPAWSGFISKPTLERYEAFLWRAVRLGYCKSDDPSTVTVIVNTKFNLFRNILNNSNHVLHDMLPAKKKAVPYSLRTTGHGRILPVKDNKNVMTRMLFKNIY